MKALRIMTAMLLLCLLVGCGRTAAPIGITKAPTATEAKSETGKENLENIIAIDYPVLPEYSKKVNAAIKAAAEIPNSWYAKDTGIRAGCGYEIMQKTEQFVSIAFSGIENSRFWEHSFFYTLNLDVTTAQEIQLVDRVKIDAAFEAALTQALKEWQEALNGPSPYTINCLRTTEKTGA